MSASLVGSEMCIRDRCSPRPPLRLCLFRIANRHLALPDARIMGGGRKGSVSYTHLTLPTICSV
eukprot:6559469-Alexandrium_andersonii.AAC.1